MLAPVGFKYDFSSKEGGGTYVVIGHINCERCNNICESREWQYPSKKHRKKGQFYSRYYWCEKCGLYVPDKNSLEIIELLTKRD